MSKVLQLRGAAAITEMLDMIGATEMPDADQTVAAILVKHEMDIRELLALALSKISEKEDPRDAQMDKMANEIHRLRGSLDKIARRYPCDNADTMSRLARETLGGF